MALAAGIHALLVLLGTVPAGLVLATLLLMLCGDSWQVGVGRDSWRVHRSLVLLFTCKLVAAPTFWAWALYNTISRHFDLGVVSFAVAVISSVIGLIKLDTSSRRYLYTQRALTGFSGLFVAANYAGGIVITWHTWTLALYMAVACAGWVIATVGCLWLLSGALSKATTAELTGMTSGASSPLAPPLVEGES